MSSNAVVEANPEEQPSWQLKELSERHKQVAALLAQGVQREVIAQACDYTPEYVTMLQKQPLFMAYVRDMTKAASVRLEALFDRSVDVIATTMVSGSEDGKLQAAKLQMEATGRIGKNADRDRDDHPDTLDALADRLVALLNRQRRRVFDGEVQEVEILREETQGQ